MMRLNRKGFTLVEIMIVVAIIALLAAIAVPNLMRARHNANEGAALGTVRTVATAAESYRSVQTGRAWPDDLTDLAGATPPYLPSKFNAATPSVQGYTYTVLEDDTSSDNVLVFAQPGTWQGTGTRTFGYSSDRGEIRAIATEAAATATTNRALYNSMTAVD